MGPEKGAIRPSAESERVDMRAMSEGRIARTYRRHLRRRYAFVTALLVLTGLALIYGLQVGPYALHWSHVLAHPGQSVEARIFWSIRLPRVLAAVVVGASLALAGAVMQNVLHNPLASPFTMGISHGAMFGAALVIGVMGAGWVGGTGHLVGARPSAVVPAAFAGAMIGVVVILVLARLRGFTPEAIVLAGVAMSALFTAATTLIQYFTDETALVSIVYWTFGDVGRPAWGDIGWMTGVFVPALVYFLWQRWNFNALESGDEVARSLGVDVARVRLLGLLIASLLTAVDVAFVGIIGFVGLICPHFVRLAIGGDHRFLLPATAVTGALLLLLADALARSLISPDILPVGVLTSFLGAPMFLYLLWRRSA